MEQIILTTRARLKMHFLGIREEMVIGTVQKGMHQQFKGKFTASKEFGSFDVSLFYKKEGNKVIVIAVNKRVNRVYKNKQSNNPIIFTNAGLSKMKAAAVSERIVEEVIKTGKAKKKGDNILSLSKNMGSYWLNVFCIREKDGRILVVSVHRSAIR